jgi:hypothetical protein
MFAAIAADAGSVNQWLHYRAPTPLDRQTVIRMNRDTLYSAAIVDISAGARLSVPDAGRRYLSVMVVNQDHYVNRVCRPVVMARRSWGLADLSLVIQSAPGVSWCR